MTAIATKHRPPGFCLPPTAIQTKPVINDKDQQARELVEIVFSITAQTSEMDFSEYKTKKRVEMDFSMTTQEPVEQVKATEVVIMTVLTMIQTTFCPTLTMVEVSLQV